MSQQQDVRIVTGAQVDKQSIKEAERGFNRLSKTAIDSARGIDSTGDNAKRAARDLQDAADEARLLDRALDDLEKPRRITVDTSRFDQTSRDVSLAGDAESNLRAVSGAIGVAGGGGLEQGLNVGAELLAVTEAIPRLKEAAAGLPQTLGAAATALGPAGLLVVGVAAGAAAIAAAYKFSIKEQEEALKNFAEASKAYVDFAAGGGTADEALQRQAENVRRIEFLEIEKARIEQEYAERRFNILDRLLNSGEQALADTAKEFEEDIAALGAENERFTEAIENNELASNDAAAAAEETARSFTNAADALDSVRVGQQQQAQTAQQAARSARSLSKAQQLQSASAQRAAKREAAWAKARQQQDALAQRIRDRNRKREEETLQASSERADALNDINTRRAEAINQREQAIFETRRSLADNLLDLQRDQSRAFEDAFASGDVLGLRDATRNIERRAEDLQIDAGRREVEVQREYNTQKLDLQRQYENLVLGGLQQLTQAAAQFNAAAAGQQRGSGSLFRQLPQSR